VTSSGRWTLWVAAAGGTGLVLVLLFITLESISSLVDGGAAACLNAPAPPPRADFVRDVVVREERVHITYDDGVEVTLPRGPRRIVSSLPGITEMVAYLGGGERLVAVTQYCDFPPAVKGLPQVSVLPFDAEAVLAARADLLIVDRRLHRRDLEMIRRRVPNVLLLETSRSLPHLAASLSLLGKVLGGEQAARRVRGWQARLDKLLRSLQATPPRPAPRVLVVAQWEPLYVMGSGSLLDDLLRVCGCVNVACDLESDASGTYPEELVLARRPDWILWTRDAIPGRLAERWRHLPAVEDGRISDASSNDLVRAGPRILDGLERLGAVLRGEREPAFLGSVVLRSEK